MTQAASFEPESERVTRQLSDEILDGVRAPGSRLVERDLAAELGVSRGCRLSGARCPVPGARCPVRDARCGMRDARCGMRGAGCGVRGAGCGVRGAGCAVRGAGCAVPGARCGMRFGRSWRRGWCHPDARSWAVVREFTAADIADLNEV
ncbi:GntR family transcriptional regulator [Saccharopolyspora spinosa]|uniref:GntR family transcriptional regulator n=1 Tax=Saccharopolyspora spinosa TaxID=60894 RepID=UPI003748D566